MTTTIEQRIEALERQNRRLKLLGGATIGLVLLALAAGQATSKKAEPPASKGRVIEAEAFVLKDRNGLLRAELTVGDDGSAGLAVYDKSGKPRLALGTSPEGGALKLWDAASEKPRLALMTTSIGPTLAFGDESGRPRMLLSMRKSGPIVELEDTNGTARLNLTVTKDGPSLNLRDARGESRAVLGVSAQKASRTETVTIRPESSLVLYDKEGKGLWQAPQD